ncbi:MAG: diguanylate cyclase [Thermodesulfobacteriota bacterium]|nr:diguanylate cyclase [Thermodesulfobacteriota bacterium]
MKKGEYPSILLVDGKPENLIELETIFDHSDINTMKAFSWDEALDLIGKYDFAVVLLHIETLDLSVSETVRLTMGNEKIKDTPMIFITPAGKVPVHAFSDFESGLFDHLFKPLEPEVVKSKVGIFIELYRQKKSLEEVTQHFDQLVMELNTSKEIIKTQNEKLNEISILDGLTGLYNHHHMEQVLEQEFSRSKRYKSDLSCLLMDLDYFKGVNDTLGHVFGDFVLREFSIRMKKCTRESDLSFRYGGEEFLVLLPQTDIHDAQIVAEKIRTLCESKPYYDGKDAKTVTISIGLASIKAHQPMDDRELLAYADKALYRAKAEGRNRITIYSEESVPSSLTERVQDTLNIKYLKENISAILEKTRKASVDSIELMVRDLNASHFRGPNVRVLKYLDLMGDRLRLPASIIHTLKRAASLHDCFKILLGQTIMSGKKSMNDEERSLVEDHPYMLAELTDLFDFFANERSILLCHHENYDGSGYPEGLNNGQIPLGAKIFAIIDSFVSQTSNQNNQNIFSVEEAKRALIEGAGTEYDPKLVDIFLDIVGEEERN